MPEITLRDEAGQQIISKFWVGSGEEGVQYNLFSVEEEIGTEQARLLSENESLRKQVFELRDRLDTISFLFAKIYPVIQKEIEIDEEIKNQPKPACEDVFSSHETSWIVSEDILKDYFDD
jgi:hypothetical protein